MRDAIFFSFLQSHSEYEWDNVLPVSVVNSVPGIKSSLRVLQKKREGKKRIIKRQIKDQTKLWVLSNRKSIRKGEKLKQDNTFLLTYKQKTLWYFFSPNKGITLYWLLVKWHQHLVSEVVEVDFGNGCHRDVAMGTREYWRSCAFEPSWKGGKG